MLSARGLHVRPVRLALALLLGLAVGIAGPGAAAAAPAPTLEQVRRQVARLRQQAEDVTERHNAVREDIAGLNVRLAAARSKYVVQEAVVAQARQALGRTAVDVYKAGDLDTLSLFVSDDPDGYVESLDLQVSLADRSAQAVHDLLVQRRELVAVTTDVEAQQQRLRQGQKELEVLRRTIEHRLSKADALLGRLTAEQRSQLARQDAAADRDGLAGQGVRLPRSGRPTCEDLDLGPLDARVSAVIAYACAQLGDPYRWGASGPGSFDCSGLSLMAWKQAGVSLPHNAAMQARYGTAVGLDELRPGDLVFFHSPIGHDGIYLGGGLMIHAPRTGDTVKIAPMRYSGTPTAAVRL